jgi:type IV secretory pathway VirB2 component (pilin)
MWKLHSLRLAIIAVVFVLLYGFDALAEYGWFSRMPVIMGIASVLLGLLLARRVERTKHKKNKD